MALRARRLCEDTARDVGAEPRRRRGHRLEVGVNRLRPGVAHEPGVERRHDAARMAELSDERIDGELGVRQRWTHATAGARAVATEATLRDVQLSARAGGLGGAHRRTK